MEETQDFVQRLSEGETLFPMTENHLPRPHARAEARGKSQAMGFSGKIPSNSLRKILQVQGIFGKLKHFWPVGLNALLCTETYIHTQTETLTLQGIHTYLHSIILTQLRQISLIKTAQDFPKSCLLTANSIWNELRNL